MALCGLVRKRSSLRWKSFVYASSSFMLRTCSESTATCSGSKITSASFKGAFWSRVFSSTRFAITWALRLDGKTTYRWKSKRSRKLGPSRYLRRGWSVGKSVRISSTTQAEKVSRMLRRLKLSQTSVPVTGPFAVISLCWWPTSQYAEILRVLIDWLTKGSPQRSLEYFHSPVVRSDFGSASEVTPMKPILKPDAKGVAGCVIASSYLMWMLEMWTSRFPRNFFSMSSIRLLTISEKYPPCVGLFFFFDDFNSQIFITRSTSLDLQS
mmetsp:Transcript_29171/g.74125  ORF Transcript_29171/g.74125 Transcript_29171/m.74125 type:complete len:267 (+) Transcript_29171:1335-2135(+)